MKYFVFAVLALSSSLALSACAAERQSALGEKGFYVLPAATDPPAVSAPPLRPMTAELRDEVRALCGDPEGSAPLPSGPLYDRDDLSALERDHAEGTLSAERVVRLQRRLAEEGHYLGDLDGIYGTHTREALRDYIAEAEREATSEVRSDLPLPSAEEVRRMGETFRNTVAVCWFVDPGAKTPAVTMTLDLDPEGQLRGPPVVVERERLSDRRFRSATYRACEAVVRCAPFSGLPPEHYGVWKSMRLRFDGTER